MQKLRYEVVFLRNRSKLREFMIKTTTIICQWAQKKFSFPNDRFCFSGKQDKNTEEESLFCNVIRVY